MCENSKYAPRATVLLVSLFDFYISLPSGLSIRARSSSLSASTSFGCPFFVGQSCQHINQLGRHRLTIHFALLISASRHSLQRYNKFRSLLSQSPGVKAHF